MAQLFHEALGVVAGVGHAQPLDAAKQNDVVTYGLSFARAMTQQAEIVGEIHGHTDDQLLMRGSAFAGSASYSEVRALARQFKGEDPHGHRAEFIRLVGAAEGVSRLRAAR